MLYIIILFIYVVFLFEFLIGKCLQRSPYYFFIIRFVINDVKYHH
jgi:hypothetical protein